MSGRTRVYHNVPEENLIRIEPRKLGRHYYKIPQKIKEVLGGYPRLISDYFLSQFRTGIELKSVDIRERSTVTPDCSFRAASGRVGFSVDRRLLNEALERYYGSDAPTEPATLPATSSEHRLRNRVAQDVIDLFSRALLAGDAFGPLKPTDNSYGETVWEFVVSLEHVNSATDATVPITIYLDGELADELVHGFAEEGSARGTEDPIEKVKQLPVRLDCVLAELQMPLQDILRLEPNDVVMLRALDRCSIRINQQPYFQGAVYESDGTLCVTSFEPVKKT